MTQKRSKVTQSPNCALDWESTNDLCKTSDITTSRNWLEAEFAAGLRNGVERFEVMLKPFGLDGSVPEKLRRDMFEFGQIRNAIVHRGGHVDRQLSNACPWLGFAVGEELPIGRINSTDTGKLHTTMLSCLSAAWASVSGKI